MVERGNPVERMWARVCREGGARVQTNVFLRDLNLPGVTVHDGRRIEVIANGLPLFHGAQVAIDATIVSPLRGDGQPVAGADRHDGIAIHSPCNGKHAAYRELTHSR